MTKNATNPSMDFRGLILGFSGAAMHYLGEVTVPGETPTINLPLAHQNIEIIALLSEKTKGNLNDEEETLMRQLLLDLRMRYIEKSRIGS